MGRRHLGRQSLQPGVELLALPGATLGLDQPDHLDGVCQVHRRLNRSREDTLSRRSSQKFLVAIQGHSHTGETAILDPRDDEDFEAQRQDAYLAQEALGALHRRLPEAIPPRGLALGVQEEDRRVAIWPPHSRSSSGGASRRGGANLLESLGPLRIGTQEHDRDSAGL